MRGCCTGDSEYPQGNYHSQDSDEEGKEEMTEDCYEEEDWNCYEEEKEDCYEEEKEDREGEEEEGREGEEEETMGIMNEEQRKREFGEVNHPSTGAKHLRKKAVEEMQRRRDVFDRMHTTTQSEERECEGVNEIPFERADQQWMVVCVSHRKVRPFGLCARIQLCGVFETPEEANDHGFKLFERDERLTILKVKRMDCLLLCKESKYLSDDNYKTRRIKEIMDRYSKKIEDSKKEFEENLPNEAEGRMGCMGRTDLNKPRLPPRSSEGKRRRRRHERTRFARSTGNTFERPRRAWNRTRRSGRWRMLSPILAIWNEGDRDSQ